MNLVQKNLIRAIDGEILGYGGFTSFKAHALRNLQLRTVLKESHCSPIHNLVFNTLNPEHRNLFATVGKDQVTVYDDAHMGDYLAVVVHYVNSQTPHQPGGAVTCCAWVQSAGLSPHELGDAWLAVAGPSGIIQLISVAEARVTRLLKGHACEVVELCGCAGAPGLLLSLGADGGLRLWDLAAAEGAECLAALESDAVSADLHPDGSHFLTGHRGGRICRWALDLDLAGRDASAALQHPPGSPPQPPAAADVGAAPGGTGGEALGRPPCEAQRGPWVQPRPVGLRGGTPSICREALSLPGPLGEAVDCVRCIPGDRIAAKSTDGRLAVWSMAGAGGGGEGAGGQPTQLLSLRVPGWSGAGASRGGPRFRFSVTRDGAYLCVGNPAGDVYLYDAASGARVAAHASAPRLGGGAVAAVLSEDGRHLLAARGSGFLLRYEYFRQGPPAGSDREAVGAGGAAAAGEAPPASPATAGASGQGEGDDPRVADDGAGDMEGAAWEADGTDEGGAGAGGAGQGEPRPAKRLRVEEANGSAEGASGGE